jgi:hypothetical protein
LHALRVSGMNRDAVAAFRRSRALGLRLWRQCARATDCRRT